MELLSQFVSMRRAQLSDNICGPLKSLVNDQGNVLVKFGTEKQFEQAEEKACYEGEILTPRTPSTQRTPSPSPLADLRGRELSERERERACDERSRACDGHSNIYSRSFGALPQCGSTVWFALKA